MTQDQFNEQYDDFISGLDVETQAVSDEYSPVDEAIYLLVIAFLLSLQKERAKYIINNAYYARLYELRADILNLFNINENIVPLLNKASDYNIQSHLSLNKISDFDVSELRNIHFIERDRRVSSLGGWFERIVLEPILGMVNGMVAGNVSVTSAKKILSPLKKGEAVSQGLYKASSVATFIKNTIDDATTEIPNLQSNHLVAKYKFKYFMWVGSLAKNSRPLCVHLITKGGIEMYKNVRYLVATYPQGLYKGTDETNITQVAGGNRCRHRVFPLRDPRIFI